MHIFRKYMSQRLLRHFTIHIFHNSYNKILKDFVIWIVKYKYLPHILIFPDISGHLENTATHYIYLYIALYGEVISRIRLHKFLFIICKYTCSWIYDISISCCMVSEECQDFLVAFPCTLGSYPGFNMFKV